MSPYILRSIDENPTGRPIYGQLVGHEPEYLARDAQVLMEHACAGVDLNMGCPAPIVCRRNAGGGMLRSLKAMDAALGALRDVLPPEPSPSNAAWDTKRRTSLNGFFR